jgi:hypothetical protein
MDKFIYNDTEFALVKAGAGWDVKRKLPGGGEAFVATRVFPGIAANDAGPKALALVKAIYPVGVRIVGPDVAHPTMIGNLRIVGPDVTHPNFIYWDKSSVSDTQSFPK